MFVKKVNTKRIIASILAMVMVIGTSACGQKQDKMQNSNLRCQQKQPAKSRLPETIQILNHSRANLSASMNTIQMQVSIMFYIKECQYCSFRSRLQGYMPEKRQAFAGLCNEKSDRYASFGY